MDITITINTDNDAFQPDPGSEIARILDNLADKLEMEIIISHQYIRDLNGNICGDVTITDS
jgi:hypothetical protein